MKKLASIVVISCFYLPSTAQVKDAKDSLKNDIRQYVLMLNHSINLLDKMENVDSIKESAAAIHTSINTFFVEIRRIYDFNKQDRKGLIKLGAAIAMNSVSPGSGTYFQNEAVNNFLHHTDNDKYFKKLDRVNAATKKLQANNSHKKTEKLKEKLVKSVNDLNEIPLK